MIWHLKKKNKLSNLIYLWSAVSCKVSVRFGVRDHVSKIANIRAEHPYLWRPQFDNVFPVYNCRTIGAAAAKQRRNKFEWVGRCPKLKFVLFYIVKWLSRL